MESFNMPSRLIVLWPPVICPSLSILFHAIMQWPPSLDGALYPTSVGVSHMTLPIDNLIQMEISESPHTSFSTSIFALFHNHGNVMPRPACKTILDHPRAADLQHVTAPSRYVITRANWHSHDWLQMNVSQPRSAKPSLDHLSTAKL